jgi:hypothetical protein
MQMRILVVKKYIQFPDTGKSNECKYEANSGIASGSNKGKNDYQSYNHEIRLRPEIAFVAKVFQKSFIEVFSFLKNPLPLSWVVQNQVIQVIAFGLVQVG